MVAGPSFGKRSINMAFHLSIESYIGAEPHPFFVSAGCLSLMPRMATANIRGWQMKNHIETTDLPDKLLPFIWHFLKPYKGIVIMYVCIAMLAGCWGPFNSMLIKTLINILTPSQIENISLLTWPAVLLVLNFIVFDNFTWRTIGYLNCKFQPVIKNQIISETFNFVLGSSHQYFQDNLSGRISSQINALADNIERILHNISY